MESYSTYSYSQWMNKLLSTLIFIFLDTRAGTTLAQNGNEACSDEVDYSFYDQL